MKTRGYIFAAIGVSAVFLCGVIIGKRSTEKQNSVITVTKETRVDTLIHYAPTAYSEVTVGRRRYVLPTGKVTERVDSIVADTVNTSDYNNEATPDSTIVELPIIQRHYTDSVYEAWVSGPIDPRLDSLRVFAPTTFITSREWRATKRWHLGVTAGYGYGRNGFEPFLGVGITYSIIDF